MSRTKSEMEIMTVSKTNSKNAKEKMVSDELLKMGFSYSYIGTHYLHDSIFYAIRMNLEAYANVRTFCGEIGNKVSQKYGVSYRQYCIESAKAIEKAFTDGNVDYMLEVFKGAYNRERMTVLKTQFIMVLRNKLLNEMEEQRGYTTSQLRLIIQGTVDRITDERLLEGLCNIVLSMEGQVMA